MPKISDSATSAAPAGAGVAGLPAPVYTYAGFRALVSELAAQRRTSGPDQLPLLVRTTHDNQAHLDRAHAAALLPALAEHVRRLPRPELWLVLAETWCGDTAHTLPVLARLAAESQGRVELRVALRSDHPELMAAYQTHGKNSIPKLIRRDLATGRDLGTWGPRPAAAQALSEQLHADKSLPITQVIRQMNAWYDADGGQSVQHELLSLL